MSNKISLSNWNYIGGDRVCLHYSDGTRVFVTKNDFDRAFGCIISALKDEVIRDFAIL